MKLRKQWEKLQLILSFNNTMKLSNMFNGGRENSSLTKHCRGINETTPTTEENEEQANRGQTPTMSAKYTRKMKS